MDDWKKHRPNLPASPAKKVGADKATKGQVDKQKVIDDLARRLNIPSIGAAVYLVVDCSGSMADERKLSRARSGALEFAESAIHKGYAVGLITFADNADVIVDPTRKLDDLHRVFGGLCAGGTTNMSGALESARGGLRKRSSSRAVVLITDGEANDKLAALDSAESMKSEGIDIIAIGTDDADHDFLRRLATRSELATVVAIASLDKAIARAAQLLALPSRT